MIAFGTSITDPEAYRRYARAGIHRVREPDSEVLAIAAVGAIARGYNLLLDLAARLPGLEALVLVNQEVELTDPGTCGLIRRALEDDRVAAIGCAGATGVRSMAWWDGEVHAGDVTLAFNEEGGGTMPAFSWTTTSPVPAEVEALDGAVLCLSPWAVQNVRFDEALGLGHGYDVDYCFQLREQGRAVVAADLAAVYHRPLELVDDKDLFIESHVQLSEKWEGRMPGFGDETGDWKQRARNAEAVREAARTIAYSTASETDARALPLERELERIETSQSWRLTRPLRSLNARRAARRR